MLYYIKIALQHLAMGFIIPITIVWKLDSGLDLTAAIATEAIVLLSTALFDLPAGFIANKINNRKALLLGALFHVIAVAMMAVGSNFEIFAIAAVMSGIAWAFTSGADEAYIHDDLITDKKQYKHVFATANIVDECATIVGMLICSVTLYIQSDLRTLFVIAASILTIHLLYSILFLPKSRSHPSLSNADNAISSTSVRKVSRQDIKRILPVMIAFAVVYEAARPLWQPHMQQIGIDLTSFGVIFAVLKLASLSGSIIARQTSFAKRHLAIVYAIMLASLLVFGTSFKIVSIVALCAYLFTENYFRVYMSSVLNKAITANRAALLSVGSVIRNGTGALMLFAASYVTEVSIAWALIAIVIIKIPAILYLFKYSYDSRTV